ncbi:MAG TPA: YaiO family outer membrane beta-barrel protein [Bacteroidales bacterium]|nr:YaiO family outer membrane beta-barrel protein [Bacteroidales bacterium]
MSKQYRKIWLVIILLIYYTAPISAQSPTYNINLDSLFLQARELAFEQNRVAARALCRQILEINPDYHDASILYARTLAWEYQYTNAAIVLQSVIGKDPVHEDALLALTDVMVWSGNFSEAIRYLDRVLVRQPTNTGLLYRKASILNLQEEGLMASVVLAQLLELDPTHAEARRLLTAVQTGWMQNHFSINYRGDYFDQSSPWHLVFAEYGRRTSALGLINFRLNMAERFDNQGLQFEIDAHPILSQGTYLYLNAGYSPHQEVFPEIRAGLELFQKLPRHWEISAGARFMSFPGNDLLILTGSINKYFHKYLITFRPFYTIPTVGEHAQSYFLTLRRYFTSPDHHLTLTAGTGFAADADALFGAEMYNLESNLVMLNYQQKISAQFLVRVGGGFQYYPDGVWGNKYTFEAGVVYRF